MAADINKVFLTGRLTKDAELRSTRNGTPVVNFSIASNKSVKVDGEWTTIPNFVNCTMFGKYAEAISGSLLKGVKISLSGELHFSSWESNGQKRSALDVLVNDVVFMSLQNHEEDQQPEPVVYDRDIPF